MSFIRPIYISDGDRPAVSQQSDKCATFSYHGKYEDITPLHEENIPGAYLTQDIVVAERPADSFSIPRVASSNYTRIVMAVVVHASHQSQVNVRTESFFDFGSGAPLPAAKAPKQVSVRSDERQGPVIHDYSRRPSGNFQSLWENRDGLLLSYLAARRVSERFLVEIDIFLENHPEILRYAPSFAERFNHATPLEAYQFFVKGYTRPARYIAGTLDTSLIPALLPRLTTAYDEELTRFFEGYQYRYDILQRIDQEVAMLYDRQCHGQPLRYDQKILVAYVAFGNPVDAYKQFEYNYQTDWLQHRYLPEHVVLSELPAYAKKSQPLPRTDPLSQHREVMTSYPIIRRHLAAANDAGVDVIDVLLDDFVAELVRKGCSRRTVATLEEQARRAIDEQREHDLGDDIVELVMDMVNDGSRKRRLVEGRSQKLRRADNGPPEPERHQQRAPAAPKQRRAQMHAPISRVPDTKQSQTAVAIGVIRDMVRQQKRDLQRLQQMETSVKSEKFATEQHIQSIVNARRRAERLFVQRLLQFLRVAKRINKKTADDLNKRYSKKNQLAAEEGGYRMDIMAFCPADI